MPDYLDLIGEDLDAAAARLVASPRAPRRRAATRYVGAVIVAAALVIAIVLLAGGSDSRERAVPSERPHPAGGLAPISGQLPLTSADGSDATGTFRLSIAANTKRVSYEFVGRHLPAARPGRTYAMWLVGGSQPNRLPFLLPPPAGAAKTLAATGPPPGGFDTETFSRWLTSAKRLIVTVESTPRPRRPGSLLLSGRLSDYAASAPALTVAQSEARIAQALGPDIQRVRTPADLRNQLGLGPGAPPPTHVFVIPPPAGSEIENTPPASTTAVGWYLAAGKDGICEVYGPSSGCGGSLQAFLAGHDYVSGVHSELDPPFIAFSGIVPDGYVTARAKDAHGTTLEQAPIVSNAYYLKVPGLYRGRHGLPYPKVVLVRADGREKQLG